MKNVLAVVLNTDAILNIHILAANLLCPISSFLYTLFYSILSSIILSYSSRAVVIRSKDLCFVVDKYFKIGYILVLPPALNKL